MADTRLNPTNRQKDNLRAKLTKSAANIADRVQKNANGTLTDKEGNPIEMTAGQLKSAEMILSRCVSTLTSSQIEDITERKTGEEIKQDALSFLMKAGMDEQQANEALIRMAKATH